MAWLLRFHEVKAKSVTYPLYVPRPMKIADRLPVASAAQADVTVTRSEIMGIVIRDRRQGPGASAPVPRMDAFVYGEFEPKPPTLPFGRWKALR